MYRLKVKKTEENKYIVNHYHKSLDFKFLDFPSSLSRILEYAKYPEILIEKPILENLTITEEVIIKDLISLILEKRIRLN